MAVISETHVEAYISRCSFLARCFVHLDDERQTCRDCVDVLKVQQENELLSSYAKL